VRPAGTCGQAGRARWPGHARGARAGVQRPPALRRGVRRRRAAPGRRRVVVFLGARRGRRDVLHQRDGGSREPGRRRGGVGAHRGVAGVSGGGREVVPAVAEEAAVEVDAAAVGGEAVRQLHAALRVAEQAVCGGEVAHALREAGHRVVALAGAGGAEARALHVLVDHLHGGVEAHVETRKPPGPPSALARTPCPGSPACPRHRRQRRTWR